MKRLILVAILLLFSFSAQAQLSNAYTTVKEKVTTTGPQAEKNCPVYSYTPRGEVVRSPWEVELRNNLMDIPSNGRVQGHTENFDIQIIHNLSASFGVYVWYGTRNATKNEVTGSKYDEDWESQTLMAGAHLYLTPIIRIFGGGGNIWLSNEAGDPVLDVAVEKGIAFDIPIGDYKLTITYKVVEAQLKDEVDISEITGDGSYQVGAIGLSIPLNYGQGVRD